MFRSKKDTYKILREVIYTRIAKHPRVSVLTLSLTLTLALILTMDLALTMALGSQP